MQMPVEFVARISFLNSNAVICILYDTLLVVTVCQCFFYALVEVLLIYSFPGILDAYVGIAQLF